MDFADLDYAEFELLVGLLLKREDFTITRTPRDSHPFGPDFEARSPDGSTTFVEVKHFRRSGRVPMSIFDQFAGELARLRKQYSDARGILVFSGTPTNAALQASKVSDPHLTVWNGEDVRRLVRKHQDVLPILENAKAHRADIAAAMQSLKSPAATSGTFSSRLLGELQEMHPGRETWRAYEKLGTRILTELFEPALGAPDVQTRSEDGLDIMDAVFPIRAASPPWSLVRSEYQSRFCVAEFKNYDQAIGQREVESIAQYLWKKAHRSFGLLVSRKGPDHTALKARRRAWVEQDKLIVLLSDDDLVDMAQLWEEDQDPFQVLDAQLEDFFRKLNP